MRGAVTFSPEPQWSFFSTSNMKRIGRESVHSGNRASSPAQETGVTSTTRKR